MTIEPATKAVTISQFLTPVQIRCVLAIYKDCGRDVAAAVTRVQVEVIAPNMAAINKKLGQENDARYLAYVVVGAIENAEREKGAN